MTLTWAINPIVAKIAMGTLPPLLLAALRTVGAGLVILPLYLRERSAGRSILMRDWPRLLFIGLVLQISNQALFIVGLQHTSVGHGAFLFTLSPVLVLLMAAALGQEQVGWRKVGGMLLCLAGVGLLSSDRGDSDAPATLYGDGLVLAGTVMFAAFTVLSKNERGRYGSVALNTVAYCSGAVVYQMVIWFLYADFDYSTVSWQAWAAVAYMSTLPAVAGYLIYQWALGHAPASKIAVLQYVQPLLIVVMGAFLLGEKITAALSLSGGLILAGVVLAERAPR
ncbi:MAG: EamA family transporter [Acidobacteria bacterium]|nr:EamA family transporter [Acidobacteriota bacterium]